MSDMEPRADVTYGPVPRAGNGLAIAALVLGIVSLVTLCVWYIAVPCAVLAIIFGFIGRGKAKAGASGGGMAVAGIVCGFILLALYLLVVFAALACGAALLSGLPGITEAAQQAAAEAQPHPTSAP